MKVKLEKLNYGGWPNCVRLSTGKIELVVTTDVGPRIMRCGFIGGDNEFAEYKGMLGKTGGNQWRIYGGHRLWHAPESAPRSYFPDNTPIEYAPLRGGAGIRLIQPTESTTGVQKEMEVRLTGETTVEVLHRLRNRSVWTLEVAPWALSVMAPGGRAIIPLPPRGTHPKDLPPTNSLTLWAYTDLSDPRWTLGFKYILLQQDARRRDPQKLGVMCPDGWIAYARGGRLFAKKFRHQLSASYPDLGCSIETFTNPEMLEIETLGPLAKLTPGAAVTHLEEWSLFQKVREPKNDAEVERHILPLINGAR